MHMPAPFNRLVASVVRQQGRYAERIHRALIEATTAGLHQELIDLIAAGDDDTVLARLQAGVPPQVLNHEHAPSLIFWAAVYRRHRLIEPLLAAGVDPIRQRDWDPKVIRGSNPFGVPVLAWNDSVSNPKSNYVEPPASTLLQTSKASLLLAAGSLRDAYLMKYPKQQGVISAEWIRDNRWLFHFPGPTSAGVSTGRAAITVPIIAQDDPRYPDAMAALSALLRAGVDAAAPLIYALIAGRPDVVRVVVDNARDKEHLAQYICEVALHQDFLPPRQALIDIVNIWTSLPGGAEALLSPQLFHRAARAHSIDFLRILIDHARTFDALKEPLNTVDRLLNGINQFVFYEGHIRSEDLEEFRGNTALTEALIAAHSEWHRADSPNVHNALRIADLFLEAGADPGPALAMMDFQWPSRDQNAVNHMSRLVRDTAMGQELLARANAYKSRRDIQAAIGDVEPPKMHAIRM